MLREKSLFWQLFVSYLLIALLSLVAVTWFATRSLGEAHLAQTAADLQAFARLAGSRISAHVDPPAPTTVDRLCKEIGRDTGVRITVVLVSGEVIGDSNENPAVMENHGSRPEILAALEKGGGRSTRFSRTLGIDMLYVGLPLSWEGRTVGVVRASTPLAQIRGALRDIRIKFVLGCLVVSLAAALISLVVSRRISDPIERMKRWAQAISRGDFQSLPPRTTSEELGALAKAMGHMSRQLQERLETVQRQRGEIQAMLASMEEGVVAVDLEERVISMNRSAGRIFGCSPDEVRDRSLQEAIRNTQFQSLVRQALTSARPVEQDMVVAQNGERLLTVHGTPLRSAEGRRLGALIVLNDVTRLKRLERIRKDFVANVSHEIKTPITAIKGFVETLRSGAVEAPEDRARFLGIIEKHANRLQAIVEDLLSLSRIEQQAEQQGVSLSREKLKDSLLTALQICQQSAEQKGITIHLNVDDGLRANVNAPLLEQAVVNLLDNAIKYSSQEGEVWLEARQTDSEAVISVRDEGCGIARDNIPRLFERFYRVDKGRSRQLGGTGLGLAIVKHIAQAHGGRATVQSDLGRGSVFNIHLPLR